MAERVGLWTSALSSLGICLCSLASGVPVLSSLSPCLLPLRGRPSSWFSLLGLPWIPILGLPWVFTAPGAGGGVGRVLNQACLVVCLCPEQAQTCSLD